MDMKVKRHLARKGIYRTRLPEEKTFSHRAPEFMRWFHEEVMGFDPEEYRREFWREANRNGHTIGDMPYGLKEYMRRRVVGVYNVGIANALEYCLWMGGSFAIWFMRRQIDRHLGRLRRPSYYEAERTRRLALAEERRRIRRRSTLNDEPTVEALREAFRHRRDSVEAVVRLGSLLEDLECYVDNSAIIAGGRVVGRRGGVRKWLHDNAQDLYAHYKRLMHYKALAKKFRQTVGIADPLSAAAVLPPPIGVAGGNIKALSAEETEIDAVMEEKTCQEFTSDEILDGKERRDEVSREFNSDWNSETNGGCLAVAKRRAWSVLLEAKEAGGTALALEAQLARALAPEFAPLDDMGNSILGNIEHSALAM